MRDARWNSAIAPLAIALAIGLLALSPAARAAKKDRALDRIWTHPDYAGFGVDRIAMLQPVSYDNDLPAGTLTDGLLAQSLRGSGYRWIGSTSARDVLRGRPGGDSLLKAVSAKLLTEPRVDSLSAPRLCAMLRCDAVLSVRIDQWQQQVPEWNQSGKPSTTVQLRAALVDSSGALLWSASGSHSMEGPYYDPNAGLRGVKDSGLDRKPMTNQGGAPTFREVVTVLVNRWAPSFPAKPAAPAAPADSAVAR